MARTTAQFAQYGITVESTNDSRRMFQVQRFGQRYWARNYYTKATAQKWARRCLEECRAVGPLCGLSYAPAHIQELAVRRAEGR